MMKRKRDLRQRSPETKCSRSWGGGRKIYSLAIPDCLRCAQYWVDDSVMAHGISKARGCRETWLCTTIQTAG